MKGELNKFDSLHSWIKWFNFIKMSFFPADRDFLIQSQSESQQVIFLKILTKDFLNLYVESNGPIRPNTILKEDWCYTTSTRTTLIKTGDMGKRIDK